MPLPPSWWSDKAQAKVSRLGADSPVRVTLDGPVPGDLYVDVLLIPERALWRALQRLTGRVGREMTSLRIDASAKGSVAAGAVSEIWMTTQPHPRAAPAQFVARADGFPNSGPLFVSDSVIFETERARGSVDVDPAAATGLPIPIKLSAESGRGTFKGTVFAPIDPAVEIRVMTPSVSDWPLETYLRDYFGMVEREYEIEDPGRLLADFGDDYGSYLADDAGLGAEVDRPTLELGAGDEAEIAIALYAERPGRSMFALLAVDVETGDPVAASELVGIGVDDDGTVDRDF